MTLVLARSVAADASPTLETKRRTLTLAYRITRTHSLYTAIVYRWQSTHGISLYIVAAPLAAHPQLALPPMHRAPAPSPPLLTPPPSLARLSPVGSGVSRRVRPLPPPQSRSRWRWIYLSLDDGDARGECVGRVVGRDVEGRHNRGRDVGAEKGINPDRLERGRLREVQAREFGVDVEGVVPDRSSL